MQGGSSWAVGGGRVQAAICLALSASHPAGKWWPLLVTWLGGLFVGTHGLGRPNVLQPVGQGLCQ